MSVKLICLSHTPLIEFASPPREIRDTTMKVIHDLAKQVDDYNPDLIITFGPDHFNGFFYDMMPAACVGIRAEAAGDWNYGPGTINTDEETALSLTQSLLNDGLGIACSYQMQADHGVTQPLTFLTGSLTRYPTVPIFINCAAKPLSPMRFATQLGRAVGRYIKTSNLKNKRVLILGTGGLSHDPPTPQMQNANSEIEAFLIAGKNPTADSRNTRQERVVLAAQELNQIESSSLKINTEWDRALMKKYQQADFDYLNAMTDSEISEMGGRGGHEVRCWTAAFAALAEVSKYTTNDVYYQQINEWLVGFGAITAETVR